VRRVPGCVMVLARREVPKDAELLVLRHDRAVRELTSFPSLVLRKAHWPEARRATGAAG
jgi:hypothetical protein